MSVQAEWVLGRGSECDFEAIDGLPRFSSSSGAAAYARRHARELRGDPPVVWRRADRVDEGASPAMRLGAGGAMDTTQPR